MRLWKNELIAQKSLLRGKIEKVLSRAHVCLMEQRAKNAHDQNKQTLEYLTELLRKTLQSHYSLSSGYVWENTLLWNKISSS